MSKITTGRDILKISGFICLEKTKYGEKGSCSSIFQVFPAFQYCGKQSILVKILIISH